jgi:hypothetical protein
VRVETGQFDRAADLIDAVAGRAEELNLAEWAMVAATNQLALAARRALADNLDSDALQPHIQNMTAVVDSWRAAELKAYLAIFEAQLVRLHTAADDVAAARECAARALEMVDETGIATHKAELLRAQAHTFEDADAQYAALKHAIEVAQEQGAVVFEMRCAVDAFEIVGESARPALEEALSKIGADQDWPDLAHARALLG